MTKIGYILLRYVSVWVRFDLYSLYVTVITSKYEKFHNYKNKIDKLLRILLVSIQCEYLNFILL